MAGTRENGPLLSRVVDPPGTKGGPRAGNFPGPPKNTFCPGWSHDPGQKALLSRVVAAPGTKDPPIYLPSSSAFPQHCQFLICALCRRRPLLPLPPARRCRRPRAPPTSAKRGRAARAPLPHRAASSPFELLPASAVVRHRRPPPASPVPSPSAPSSSSSPSRRRAPPRCRPPPQPPPPAGLPGPRLGHPFCAFGSPRRRLCALSLYVRRALPWPCWQPGRALPAGAAPLTLMSIF